LRFRPATALLLTALCSLAYLGGIHILFSRKDLWAPAVVPLLVQAPAALAVCIVSAYRRAKAERRQIARSAGFYLPEQVVAELSRSETDIGDRRQNAFGICLVTDAAQYSRLSEQLPPDRLGRLLNRYYEALFRPVRARGGFISDVVGDSMMAIWASPPADRVDFREACMAALEILDEVDRFNRSHQDIQLPTRIGLHAGALVIGNVGAVDHFEYRAVGDVVNSASRLEGLNKHLGTRLLATGVVAESLEGITTRYLGRFLPEGKTAALTVYEIAGRREAMPRERLSLHSAFAEAMSAFEAGDWPSALDGFGACLQAMPGDGPSAFFRNLCEGYRDAPPDGPLDAVPIRGK
jgi:adenylate cyclase